MAHHLLAQQRRQHLGRLINMIFKAEGVQCCVVASSAGPTAASASGEAHQYDFQSRGCAVLRCCILCWPNSGVSIWGGSSI